MVASGEVVFDNQQRTPGSVSKVPTYQSTPGKTATKPLPAFVNGSSSLGQNHPIKEEQTAFYQHQGRDSLLPPPASPRA